MLKFVICLALLTISLSACGAPPANDIAPAPVAPAAATPLPEPTATPVVAPSEPTPLPPTSPPPEITAVPPTPEAQVQPAAETALIFTLAGGIVGFCDELTINADGAYTLQTCQQPEVITGTLDQADLASLTGWTESLASFEFKTEDNPDNPDNLVANLVFNGRGPTEVDEPQRQIIFDWVNGLLVRLRPQAVAPPTPEPLEIGPEGLCPTIQRPAVLVINYVKPNGLTLIDPNSQATCEFQLDQPPTGRLATAGGTIYYAVFDVEAKTITVWQLKQNGEQTPLTFTTVTVEPPGPFGFTVPADGSKIAWAQAVPNFEVDPPVYRNNLWVANIDGSGQIALLDQVENQEQRYAEPVRFSPDNSTLFYALQPDGLGGFIFNFTGRYDAMYRIPTTGGQPQLIYACPQEQIICIGDISPDGSALAYTQQGQAVVQVIGADGNPVSSLTPPATDYVGSPVFGPTGNLAFVSLTLTQVSTDTLPLPNPGYISLVPPPYTGQPQTILTDNSVASLWEWVDDRRLIYGSIDAEGNIGTALITTDGQRIALSPNPALAVLR